MQTHSQVSFHPSSKARLHRGVVGASLLRVASSISFVTALGTGASMLEFLETLLHERGQKRGREKREKAKCDSVDERVHVGTS
jgi:hypothetical protein